jgi:hypothetical protein
MTSNLTIAVQHAVLLVKSWQRHHKIKMKLIYPRCHHMFKIHFSISCALWTCIKNNLDLKTPFAHIASKSKSHIKEVTAISIFNCISTHVNGRRRKCQKLLQNRMREKLFIQLTSAIICFVMQSEESERTFFKSMNDSLIRSCFIPTAKMTDGLKYDEQ